MLIDTKKAERKLREAFYAVKDELGIDNITNEEIDFFVNEESIRSVQEDREKYFMSLKRLKKELCVRFRNYRVIGRVKSLSSIFGKYMQFRSTRDAFGLKMITGDAWECYQLKEWFEENYSIVDVDDRIKSPKDNGYRDLKLILEYRLEDDSILVEVIIQSQQMFVDSQTIQAHELAYPWKYRPEIQNLPASYREMRF